ncbi:MULTISPECIES: saccharopine dehydrogenase NADP-binding domain-containing protein [Enterobacter cloacae complex]|uniref:saccharopine dehydrogenase NADP-binding domain-containing protein n=1 Tax=Enterobacter cloacae complex TaxID=354276 RepID=UPI0007984C13|nr:saccharopine dehydrogenase NADP-binding domain-containing protein [Enterobacter ludwigii]WNI43109.1 saccharopine dehydrogenase NADP-binding domain-containing protein [Enterobacter ludwigii]WNI52142.1 saccharopine dehydrogenase NADP-binding domain-containing protein [Enterobacter ludwigii]WNI83936.1 saccharopine dehydrogenase NADP-binding domain-containing protein [Enterobacter ludwigii]SAC79550.1 Putative trans-acting enoyl reductase Rv2449c [Enterobacter ludwigii]
MKSYDIAIWGATGNIGQRVVSLLSEECGDFPSRKILLVSRDNVKLDLLLNELNAQTKFSIAIADSNNDNDVMRINKSVRVVLSCIGPYASYGSKIVKHCAENGIDYVDVSGESLWIREMIERYAQKAEKTGARIVFSCGFESVPSDLSVYFLQKIARNVFNRPVSCIKARIQRMKILPLSAGTLAAHSVLMSKASTHPSVLAFILNPFGLTSGFTGPEQPRADIVKFDDELGKQASPFWGATINSKIVHLSNQLLDFPYGHNFLYDEMVSVNRDGSNAQLVNELALFSARTQIAEKQRYSLKGRHGSWLIFWHGILEEKEVIRVRVSCEQDPGCGTSAALVVESALCLLEDNLSTKGGVWTVSSCMGQNLLDRLSRKKIIDISWEILPFIT